MGLFYLMLLSVLQAAISNLLAFKNIPDNLLGQILNGINEASNQSHPDSVLGFLFIVSGILVAAIFIFIFNYFFVFKKRLKDDLTKKQMVIASLVMAIATAPYTLLLPAELFY